MRKNISKVIAAFTMHRPAVGDGKNTCSTDGTTVYSYRMPIARRLPNGQIAIVDDDDAPTRTTRAQVRALTVAFPDAVRMPLTNLGPEYRFKSLASETGYQQR